MKRVLIAVAAMLSLNACALTVDEVDVAYKQQQNVVAIGGAEAVKVQVTTNDARTSNRDRISVKKNGYGIEMAPIVSKQAVPELVANAINTELKARGFGLGGQGGVFLLVDVNKFYNDFKMGFFVGQAVGEVMLNTQVMNAGGKVFHSKTYIGEFTVPDIMLFGGENARQAVEGALAKAVEQMMADQYFIQALIEAQRGMPVAAAGAPTS